MSDDKTPPGAGPEGADAGKAAADAVEAAKSATEGAAKNLRATMTAEAYDGLGKWGKLKEGVAQNWSKSGKMEKFGRGVGTAVGVVFVGKGLKDLGRYAGMVSPKKDEQGNERPADFGTLVKSVVELGGGTALAVVSLAAGGKGRAIG